MPAIRHSFKTLEPRPRVAPRWVLLVVAAAFLLAAWLGIRHVILEGRSVEDALRSAQRLRLEAEAARIREAVESAEDVALTPLVRSWDDSASLQAAVLELETMAPSPAGHWFVVGAAGEVVYPEEPQEAGLLRDQGRSELATAALASAGDLARRGQLEKAIAAYSKFLEEFPAPAPEVQMRPLACIRLARLLARAERPSEAVRRVLDLEWELASEGTSADGDLVDFYRQRAASMLEEVGAEAGEIRPALDSARKATDARLARARFRVELRRWLAARIRLEADSTGGGALASRLAIFAAGSPRRFVLARTLIRTEPVIVGYESDLSRIRDELIPPLIASPHADALAFRLVSPAPASDSRVVRLGPALPGLHLGLAFPDTDPAARAARTRRILQGSLVGGALLVAGLAVALVFRYARQTLALARLRSEFVSGVSHELRTPVSLIQAIAETLELGHVRDDEERARYLRTMACECQRLAALIGNVLDFSRTERGKTRYVLRDAELGGLLESLVERYRPALEARNLAVELSVDEDLPPARVDPEAFSRAVLNLLDNAMKYAAESETLRIAARRDGVKIRVSVADRGPGIAPDELSRIFEPFQRGRSEKESSVRGFGLGLSLVRQVVRGMGGEVEVDSRVGEGTTFHLLLQAVPEVQS